MVQDKIADDQDPGLREPIDVPPEGIASPARAPISLVSLDVPPNRHVAPASASIAYSMALPSRPHRTHSAQLPCPLQDQ